MSKIRLHGSSSGYTEIAPVAASGNNTLTLPNDGTIISKDSAGAIGVTSVHTTKLVSTGTIDSDGGAITSKSSGVPIKVNSSNSNDFKIAFQNGGSTVSYLGGSSSNFFRVGNGSASSVLDVDSSSNLKFNSGYGSVATAFGVRAWVSFNGTGTPAIRGDGGVSSVGDNDTGDYTVNFDNNMPDVNYAVGGLSENWEGNNNDSYTFPAGYTSGATVGSYRLKTIRARFDQQPPQFYDPPFVQLIFVR